MCCVAYLFQQTEWQKQFPTFIKQLIGQLSKLL